MPVSAYFLNHRCLLMPDKFSEDYGFPSLVYLTLLKRLNGIR